MKFFLFLFLFVSSYHAVSQIAYNINVLPVGDIEPLLANTGTAGMRSTGAVYYNPAALTQLNQNSFSLKGTAYTLFNFKADPVATFGEQKLVYESSGFQSIPTTLIIIKKINQWRAALSVIIPMSFNFEGLTTWDVGAPQAEFKLELLQNYRERMMLIGLSAARKLNNSWSIGLSVFNQSFSYLAYQNLKLNSYVNQEFIINDVSREKYNPSSLLVILGLQRSVANWNLGLRITAPNIYMFGKGEIQNSSYSKVNADEPAERSELNVENIKAHFKTPLDFRIGLSFRPNNKFNISSDISYTLGIRYGVFNIPGFDNTQEYKSSIRISTGVEFAIKDSFNIYFGGAITPIKSENSSDVLDINFYSAATGFRFSSKYIKSTLGLHYTIGKGRRTEINSTDSNSENYSYLGLFIGTNYVF